MMRRMATRYGLNPTMFAERIVRPLLADLDKRVRGLWSLAAERLVLGTAMHESHLRFLRQIRGPAIGIFQMEPATWQDIRLHYLSRRHVLRNAVDDWAIGEPDPDEMEGNLYYAAAMCRVHYWRVPERLPDADDARGLTEYWKCYYNTPKGRGTVAQALPHFERAIAVFRHIDLKLETELNA